MSQFKQRVASALFVLFLLLCPGPCLAGSQQTSSTLASTIITNVRYYLADSSQVFWTDAELLVWLNDGIMDVIARSKCREVTESLPLAIGVYEYPIGENYIGVKQVVLIDTPTASQTALKHSNPEHFGRTEGIGQPTHWYEWSHSVVVYPAITTLDSDDYVVWQDTDDVEWTDTTEVKWMNLTEGKIDLAVYLVKRELAIDTTDTIPLPAAYDVPLILYVYAQGLLKDSQPQRAAWVLAKYEKMLERFEYDFTIQK